MTTGLPSENRAAARTAAALDLYTLDDFVTAVCYHRRAMFIAFLVPVLLAIGAALIVKPAFVAQARLLVLYGSEYFYRPAAGQPGAGVALDRNEIMLGELQVLQSSTLAIETLKAVGIERVYPGLFQDNRLALGRAALRLSKDLTLTSIPQSNVLQLSFRSYNPDIAAEVLRALISGYMTRRTAIFQRSETTTLEADQSAFLKRLREAEDALSNFADSHGIANIDQQISLLVQQQSANADGRALTAQAIKEATARLAAIRAELPHIPQTVQTYAETDRSQGMQALSESLARLQIKRHDLAARYQDDFVLVQDADRQIASLQALIARDPSRQGSIARRGVNPVYQDAQTQLFTLVTQLAGLEATAAQLAATGAAIDAHIVELNKSARQYRDLLENRDLLDQSYRTLVRSDEEAQISDTAERSRTANIRVVQPPERPADDVHLRLILISVGVVVGLLAAFAALAVANARKQTFVNVRDVVAGLELPVVASVSRLKDRGSRRRRGGAALTGKPVEQRPAQGSTPQAISAEGVLGA